MIILGKTDDGFILQASENECAKLIGFYYADSRARDVLQVGNVIRVHELFNQLHSLKEKGESLERCASECEAIAELLRLQVPVVERALEVKIEIGN